MNKNEKFIEKLQSNEIVDVDTSSVNCWTFHFDDGEIFKLFADCGTSRSSIPYLEVE